MLFNSENNTKMLFGFLISFIFKEILYDYKNNYQRYIIFNLFNSYIKKVQRNVNCGINKVNRTAKNSGVKFKMRGEIQTILYSLSLVPFIQKYSQPLQAYFDFQHSAIKTYYIYLSLHHSHASVATTHPYSSWMYASAYTR